MKTLLPLVRALALAGALCAVLRLGAAPAALPAAWESADFHAVVSGTSTLHDWTVETRTATGGFRVESKGSGTLRIPAKSLAGGPKGLNEKMYAALKTDAHADIVFEALEVALPAEAVVTPAGMSVHGRLTVAGGTREIVVPCRAKLVSPTSLVLEATLPLKMTDFGVKPPTFMGMIRTGDEVTVKIRWTLKPSADAAARTVANSK